LYHEDTKQQFISGQTLQNVLALFYVS
jgi:hypothetical protein